MEVELFGDDGYAADVGDDGTGTVTDDGSGDGSGDPAIQVDEHNPVSFFHHGDWEIVAGDRNDRIDLSDSDGNNTIIAGDGRDWIRGGGGSNLIKVGNGNDTIYAANGLHNTIVAGGGVDEIDGGPGNDIISVGTDWKASNFFDDIITLGDGNNIFDGESSVDIVTFGLGSNTIIGGSGILLNGGGGNTIRPRYVTPAQIAAFGTAGNDILVGGPNGDELDGGYGNNTIYGGAGDDGILASAGPNGGHDVVYGGGGNDFIYGGAGDNTLYGGAGDDYIQANEYFLTTHANSILYGGDGNDTLNGIGGNATLYGGPGDDTYIVDNLSDSVIELPNQGTDTVYSLISYTLPATVENLKWIRDMPGANEDGNFGYYFQVRAVPDFTGNGLDNIIEGPGVLDGGAGNDTLIGDVADWQNWPTQTTYVFGRGYGHDTVIEANRTPTVYDYPSGALDHLNQDHVQFNAGVLPSDVLRQRDGDNLVLSITGTADALTLQSFYTANLIEPNSIYPAMDPYPYEIPEVRFADGTTWDVTALGGVILGVGGGPNTYAFGRGSGQVRAVQNDGNPFPYNNPHAEVVSTVQMGADILPTDVTVERNDNNLVLSIVGTTDQFSSQLFFVDPVYQIDQVRFADGTTWDKAALLSHLPHVNQAPTVAHPLADQRTPQESRFSFQVPANTFADPDPGDTLTYSATLADGHALPAWLNFNGTTRTLSGTPHSTDAGTISVRLTATDSGSLSASDIFGLAVTASQPHLIVGTSGNDILMGANGDDVIQGLAGNDQLNGLAGNDVLEGGTGNDVLIGGSGSDTYIFNQGFGQDLIVDSTSPGESNTVIFGQGIIAASLTLGFLASPVELFIRGGNIGGVIISQNFDPHDAYGTHAIDTFQFADGTVLSYPQLIDRGFDITGTAGNDTITGTNVVDRISGGLGNDDMSGWAGNDTYLFNRGDGVDTIHDVSAPGEGNSIQFGAGITAANLTFTQNQAAHSLTIAYDSTGDTVQLVGFDPNNVTGSLVVNTVQFSDGSSLNMADLFPSSTTTNHAPTVAHPVADQATTQDALFTFVVPTNTFADPDAGDSLTYTAALADDSALPSWLAFDAATQTFSGTPGSTDADTINVKVTATDSGSLNVSDVFGLTVNAANPVIVGTPGDDVITGGPGDDVIDAGAGNDIVNAGPGNDTITGGPGNDTLTGGPGNDTYIFHLGDGVDTIHDDAGTGDGNSIVFGPGITASDLSLGLGSLVIRVGAGGDEIHIPNFDPQEANGPHAIDTFNFADGTGLSYEQLIDRGFDLIGTDGADTITGTNVVDRIDAGAGNDIVNGGAGNDTLSGGTGSDLLDGGPGDDVLQMSADDVWSSAFGCYNAGSPGHPGTGQIVPIAGKNRLFDVFLGGDGTDTLVGTSGDDVIALDDLYSPFPQASGPRLDRVEVIRAGDGDDIVDLTSFDFDYGDVTLDGGKGNDILWASGGNDVLIGGKGNDSLVGGAGNDTYQFDRGDGQDTIIDHDATPGNNDTVAFGSNVSPSDLVLSRQADDLRIAIHGSSDQVTIQNWYGGSDNQTETIQAGNGSALVNTQVDQLIQAMATYSASSGLTWDQAVDQKPDDVQAILAASWH